MKNILVEKKKRFDVVLGVIIASVLGLLLNLLANLYYDLFIIKTVAWSDVNRDQVVALVLLLIVTLGFLSFFIADYKNDLKLNLGFWGRFFDYFFYSYAPGKFLRIASGVSLLFVLLIFSIVLFIFITKLSNLWVSILTYAVLITIITLRERAKRKK